MNNHCIVSLLRNNGQLKALCALNRVKALEEAKTLANDNGNNIYVVTEYGLELARFQKIAGDLKGVVANPLQMPPYVDLNHIGR